MWTVCNTTTMPIIEREAPIHISNVMTIHGGQATRIGYKILEDGSKVRKSIKTNEEITF